MSIVERQTKETRIRVEAKPGKGLGVSQTGVDFLDHMMVALARYSGLDLEIAATGDLRHHTIEDVAICVGAVVREITPSTAARYAHRVVPMDDALVECAVDLGGRPYYRGPLPSSLYDHIVEASFKALGLCLRDALADDGVVFSTKGSVGLKVSE